VDGDQLRQLYAHVARATGQQDFVAARAAFLSSCGLRPRPDVPPPALGEPPPRLASLVRYHRPRRIDLLALEHGGRDVAKFEDLSQADARRLVAWAQARRLNTVLTAPYTKRTDVPLADDDPTGGLYALIASRGSQAEIIADAEKGWTRDGNRAAGLALGYPPCCVEHFITLSRDGLALTDGVNEAAVRSSVGIGGEIPWEMNTLSDFSPVGFTPCRVDCPEALAFARRVLVAVERGDAAGARLVRETLQRPVLFFRLSLIVVLDGKPVGGQSKVSYRRVIQIEAGSPPLNAWLAREICDPLSSGDAVTLHADALEVTREHTRVARWEVDDARIPILFRFV
jgi:hypothetical protein